ncbi:MAG: DUF2066 domain-containing protein [Xanthomonadales bacterium]|nr:DUF2066 domain-containing protein [Xanthomonadales bacterium]
MRWSCLLLVALLLGGGWCSTARAQAATSAYSVVVPVPDTSDAQRNDAFASALAQVLARVAGGQDLRDKPGYADALQGASSLVQKYQYQRANDGIRLQVDFAPAAVQRVVAQLGFASVGARPPVLLLVQGTDGALFDQAALEHLAAAAGAKGVTVAYPQAGTAPDLERLASADPQALAQVDQHYHTGLVLLGRLHPGGADWTLVAGGQIQRWSDRAATEDQLLAAAGAGLAARVNTQLNVVGASVSEGKLWVDGLRSAMDYARLLAALRGDPAVRQVDTLGAQGDGVLLQVQAAMPLAGLAANLAANGHVLLQGTPHAGADVTLRWLR